MDIFSNTQFVTTKNNENNYIFYNSVKHFATQLDFEGFYFPAFGKPKFFM
jgi:hypothetical protein